ncbi:MAG: thiamine diphosphokinase [Ruminococcus sp.]|nr:thiamine diphosphokinase [Ruminococcus sp.]
MCEYIIFSGGELDCTKIIVPNTNAVVICADRGLEYAKSLGISPDIVLGDFDSYAGTLPENAEIHKCAPEKDDTDTMLAVKLALDRGAKKIMIYGTFGGRFDHTYANVQTLKFILGRGAEGILRDEKNIVFMRNAGTYVFERINGFYFSVFAYTDQISVRKLSGVKYPLENAVISSDFPIGVSNEILSEKAVIDIECGTALIAFSKM